MLRTKNGIIVRPRIMGHEMVLPLPKGIRVDKDSEYLIQSKDQNHIQATRINSRQNPFSDFTLKLIKNRSKLRRVGFYGIDKSKGREL